MQFIKELFQIR